jgi:hypothetical protein
MGPLGWGILGACYVGLEYWLGKTERVKPNSALDAVLRGAKAVCGILLTRKL